MQEVFEKIKERSEEEALNVMLPDGFRSSCVPLDTIKHIVNQVAEEYNNGWISADVEPPTKNGWYWGYYVTFSYIGTDGVKHTECKYASIYWEDNLWLYAPRSFRTVDEVIAWKPIAPYQPEGEK